MTKTTPIWLICLLCASVVHGQDPVFSQFYTSSLYLNPALAGLEKDVAIGMNYRSQWTSANIPFRTFQVSAIYPLVQQGVRSKHIGGVGATLFSDQAGPNREITSQGLSLASAYNFHLNADGNHLISAALQFGVLQKQIDFDALQWSSQYVTGMGYDPSLPGETLATEQTTSAVINAGAMWQMTLTERYQPVKTFYQGFAFSNLNRPKGFFLNEREAVPVAYKVHGGYLHGFSNGWEVSPNYIIQHQGTTQINVGAYTAYTLPNVIARNITDLKVSLGFWYRIEDNFIVTTSINTDKWNMGFSYDANTSAMSRNFGGAHAFEFSFGYRIAIEKQIRKFGTPLI